MWKCLVTGTGGWQYSCFIGKVELGTGYSNSHRSGGGRRAGIWIWIRLKSHCGDRVTPNEGYTGASASIQNSAMSVAYAAATARMELLELASKKSLTSSR